MDQNLRKTVAMYHKCILGLALLFLTSVAHMCTGINRDFESLMTFWYMYV